MKTANLDDIVRPRLVALALGAALTLFPLPPSAAEAPGGILRGDLGRARGAPLQAARAA